MKTVIKIILLSLLGILQTVLGLHHFFEKENFNFGNREVSYLLVAGFWLLTAIITFSDVFSMYKKMRATQK